MEQNVQNIREIDIKETIIYALRRWRSIVVYATIIALLATGFLAYQKSRPKIEKTKLEQRYDEAINRQFVLERELKTARTLIDDTTSELEHSAYVNLDYLNVYMGSILFSIELDHKEEKYFFKSGIEEKLDDISRLQSSYIKLFNGGAFYAYAREAFGLDLDIKYFNELMSVSEISNGVFSFSMLAKTEEEALKYLKLANEFIHSDKIYDFSKIAKHKVNVVDTNGRYQILDNIRTRRIELDNILVANKNIAIDKENRILNNEKELKRLIKSIESEKTIKPYIKRFVLAAVIGVVLSMIVICFKFILMNFVDTEYNIKQYFNIDTIARLGYNKKRFFIDKIIDLIAGTDAYIRDEALFSAYCTTRIASLCNADSIAFVGSVDIKLIEKFAKQIKEKNDKLNIIVCGDVSKDAKAYSDMQVCKKVIFVEKRNKSKISELELEVNVVKICGKDIVGMIML